MAVAEQPIEKLKKAYRVLDVPATASALAIKSNYRKLIKRWHPDRPATGVSAPSEAALMTTLINEAYALIENAPLRYYSGEATPPRAEKKKTAEPKIRNVNEVDLSKMFFNEKRIEYTVRIVCGTISGAFVGLAFSVDVLGGGIEIMVAIVLCAIGFAVGAVKYGDKFWRVVFGKWWMWE
jgi:hypothetical protein